MEQAQTPFTLSVPAEKKHTGLSITIVAILWAILAGVCVLAANVVAASLLFE